MRRALLLVVAAAASVLFTAAPASALPDLPPLPGIPGVPDVPVLGGDCADDVPITSPDSGPAAQIDPGPAHPRIHGQPFKKDGTSTIYEYYGWGGASWPSLNMSCGWEDITGVAVDDIPGGGLGAFANWYFTFLAMYVAIVGAVLRLAFSPDTLGILDPVMRLGAQALGENVFKPLFVFTLAITGLLLMARANRAKLADTAKGAGWVTMVGLGAIVAMLWPLAVAPAIDSAVTGLVGAVNNQVATGSDDAEATQTDAATAAIANLHQAIIYNTWCAGVLGRASGETVDKFCAPLYISTHMSRAEMEEVKGDPEAYQEKVSAKSDQTLMLAKKLKEEDPAAFAYLNGDHNAERVGFVFLGMVAAACSTPFLLLAGFLLLYALLVVRLGITMFPSVAVVGGYPPAARYVTMLFDFVGGCLVTAVVFGCMAAVFTAAIGGLLDPTVSARGIVSLILMLAMTIAAWKITKPIKRMKDMHHYKDKRAGKKTPGEPAKDHEKRVKSGQEGGIFAPSGKKYADTTPAEAKRSPITEAALGAAQGFIVGGATGAAMGAAGAAWAKFRSRGQQSAEATTPTAPTTVTAEQVIPPQPPPRPAGTFPAVQAQHALPGPRTTPDGHRIYVPGEAVPVAEPDVVAWETPTADGELTYDLYTPRRDDEGEGEVYKGVRISPLWSEETQQSVRDHLDGMVRS